METKKIKLRLKKQTVAVLNGEEMKILRGGKFSDLCYSNTCQTNEPQGCVSNTQDGCGCDTIDYWCPRPTDDCGTKTTKALDCPTKGCLQPHSNDCPPMYSGDFGENSCIYCKTEGVCFIEPDTIPRN